MAGKGLRTVVTISLFYFILRFGPRFLATVDSYDKTLSEIAKLAAVDLKLDNLMQEGVYIMIGGPTFETVAESRLLRNFGADAVGKLISQPCRNFLAFPLISVCK